jgi:(E)-4-hydroxy-3-methylbut-2-enyl-diphosphate synthase
MSSYRPYQHIERRKSRQIHVGSVAVGGDAPISVQTMTNTLTSDAAATIAQIRLAEAAGVDIVRVSCPDEESTAALGQIVRAAKVPIVADIHFHYKRAIEAAEAGAACLRINPGNIGSPERVREVIKAARDHNCSMRIGVNAGSLEKHLLEKYGEPNPEALVESALEHAKILQDNDFHEFKISVKASDVFLAVAAYQQLAEVCDHPLHVGITEAGGKRTGTVKSAIGMGNLLWAGIGDTIRVSLSAEPAEEVHVGWEILKSLGIRHRGVKIISCPSCARQGFDVIRTVAALEERLAHIETPITLSIIGCVVNGPGEALMTDIGVTGGGNGKHMVYAAGKTDHTIAADGMIDHIVAQVEKRAEALKATETAKTISAAAE